ncbi:MAG: tetratricopeptide repeat protein, partial [bacterium]|nr:tetratricopeptide repeat protein [bacterium]
MAIDRAKVQALAQKYFIKGQTDKAIKEYLLLYEDNQSDMKVCQKLGDLYVKKGDKAKAQKFQEIVAEDFTSKGFYLKAIAVYKQILRLDPNLLEINIKLADLYNRQGLPTESVSQYKLVAGQYEKAGKVNEALNVIGMMADIDPSNVMVRVKLAERYVKEGLIAKASEQILKLGDEYKKQGKPEDIIKLYEKFAALDQSNKEIYIGLGKAYTETGDLEKAL